MGADAENAGPENAELENAASDGKCGNWNTNNEFHIQRMRIA